MTTEVFRGITFDDKCERVLKVATAFFMTRPARDKFWTEIFGSEGSVYSVFTEADERIRFNKTDTAKRIHEMVENLRDEKSLKGTQRVATIRMPAAIYETLKQEAKDHKTSMNKLCIRKLTVPL